MPKDYKRNCPCPHHPFECFGHPTSCSCVRFVNCDACQTEGRILTNDGGPDDVDHGVCPECSGARVVEVKTRPAEYLTECPSCKGMFENGGQCAAPVMRGGCPMGGDV